MPPGRGSHASDLWRAAHCTALAERSNGGRVVLDLSKQALSITRNASLGET